MCGVPYHSCESYIARLVAEGLQGRHLRADGGPGPGQGPGEAGHHPHRHPRHRHRKLACWTRAKTTTIACVYGDSGTLRRCAFCDISTGAFYATVCSGGDADGAVMQRAGPLRPGEVLLLGGDAGRARASDDAVLQDRLELLRRARSAERPFDLSVCKRLWRRSSASPVRRRWACRGQAAVVMAAGALLRYLCDDRRKTTCRTSATLEYYVSGPVHGAGSDRPAEPGADRDHARARRRGAACCGCWTRPTPPWAGGCSAAWLERPLLVPRADQPAARRRGGAGGQHHRPRGAGASLCGR